MSEIETKRFGQVKLVTASVLSTQFPCLVFRFVGNHMPSNYSYSAHGFYFVHQSLTAKLVSGGRQKVIIFVYKPRV